mmetsp:Transcript_41970/g.127253  ORF Transcript_41970/g.127253 Transcript_41970/m.127253 type:complete len:143 (-) Transcript_41970:31-459(-)
MPNPLEDTRIASGFLRASSSRIGRSYFSSAAWKPSNFMMSPKPSRTNSSICQGLTDFESSAIFDQSTGWFAAWMASTIRGAGIVAQTKCQDHNRRNSDFHSILNEFTKAKFLEVYNRNMFEACGLWAVSSTALAFARTVAWF